MSQPIPGTTLFDGAQARDVVQDLMARPPQAEFE